MTDKVLPFSYIRTLNPEERATITHRLGEGERVTALAFEYRVPPAWVGALADKLEAQRIRAKHAQRNRAIVAAKSKATVADGRRLARKASTNTPPLHPDYMRLSVVKA